LTAVYNGDGRCAGSTSNPVSFSPPPIVVGGVANGASFLPGIAAPNTILALFGSNLACVSEPLALVNGVSAEILGTTDTQINFVVPPAIISGPVSVEVRCVGNRSQPYPMPSAAAAPAIFTATMTGTGQAAAANQDGSQNSASSPAARGDYISLFATGFGVYGNPDSNGLRWVNQPVAVFFGDISGAV
jgi:uncharacterized protein (TIGR03437 family)